MSPRKHTDESAALRASLLEHARRLIARDGGSALTMRALAAEAGCAVGLPYEVFTHRRELVLEIVHAEFARLDAARDQLVARAGTGTLADNLAWSAELMLDSPAYPRPTRGQLRQHLAAIADRLRPDKPRPPT